MANPKLSEALNTILPGEANKRIRQGILLAATAGKSEARTVKAELAQENRLKTGVMAVGTIDFTTTTSADLNLFAWVIDFQIFQPGEVTKTVTAPHADFARPDIFTGKADGTIGYYAGTVDSEGNAQFPEIPTGEVLLRTVIRQPNGDNDVDNSIPSSSEWVSKSATGTQAIASNLELAPLAGANPNILTAGPNGGFARTNPALAGVFSTLEGIGGFTKILTITIDPASQLNYFAVVAFFGISTAYEKGQLWVQFKIDGSGDIITNKLQCFGEFNLTKYTLVKTSPTTYALYVAHDEASSFYKFRPEPQFGSSFRYVYHHQEAKVTPLPDGDQYTFSKYSDNPLTANELASIQAADSPTALNAFVTVSALNSYAYVQEAPINTNYYARKDGVWTAFTPFAVAGTATDGHVVTSVAGVPTWVAPSGGGSSPWTTEDGFIYRNAPVVIGQTTKSIYDNFIVKNTIEQATNRITTICAFKLTDNSDAIRLTEVNGGSRLYLNAGRTVIGNPASNELADAVTIKGGSGTAGSVILRLLNSSDGIVYDFKRDRLELGFFRFVTGNPSINILSDGPTFRGNSDSGASHIFRILNLSQNPIFQISANGCIMINQPTGVSFSNGISLKGRKNNAEANVTFDNSSNIRHFELRGNGQLLLPAIPTSDPLIDSSIYEYNDGTRTYLCSSQG